MNDRRFLNWLEATIKSVAVVQWRVLAGHRRCCFLEFFPHFSPFGLQVIVLLIPPD